MTHTAQAIANALGLADDEAQALAGPPHLGLEEFMAVMEECERQGWGGARRWAAEGGVSGTDVRFLKGVAHMHPHTPPHQY